MTVKVIYWVYMDDNESLWSLLELYSSLNVHQNDEPSLHHSADDS